MKHRETFNEFIVRLLTKAFSIFTIFIMIAVVIVIIEKNNEIEALAAELDVNSTTSIKIERISVKEQVKRYINSLPLPKEEIPEVCVEELRKVEIEKEVEVVREQKLKQNLANYTPTEAERQYAYKIAFAEASTQGTMGQTLVINVAINNMRKNGFSNLIQEFEAKGRYSSVKKGEVYNGGKIVTVSDVPDSVKKAVEEAFEKDYSEEILREEAMKLGITDSKYWEGGAIYFYNPSLCSERQNSLREKIKVKFQEKEHVFYRYWDK